MFLISAFLYIACGIIFTLDIKTSNKRIISVFLQIFALVIVIFNILLFKSGVEIKPFVPFLNNSDSQSYIDIHSYKTLVEKLNKDTSKEGQANNVVYSNKLGSLFIVSFFADKYSLYFGLLICFLSIAATIYTFFYMQNIYPSQHNRVNIFTSFYYIAIAIALFCCFAGNLITMFIFYEILSLTTIPLICFNKKAEEKKVVIHYALTLVGLSCLLLFPAILISYSKVGFFNFFDSISQNTFLHSSNHTLIAVLFAMMVIGIAKAAIFPFFTWLTKAMVAPTPVSALLHAVVVVKVGVFFILRIVDKVFTLQNLSSISILNIFYGKWLFYFACITIILCSCYAFMQTNIKKMLAFSTISSLGYVVLVLSTFLPQSIDIAFFQIISHSLAKIVLFFVAGIMYMQSDKNQSVESFKGFYKNNKILAFCILVACSSIIGLPFTSGSLSKKAILELSVISESFTMQITLFVSLVFTSIYLFRILFNVFFTTFSSRAQSKAFNGRNILTALTLLISLSNLFLWFILA